MSELTKFYTFEQMENAINVSSETTNPFVAGHPPSHAINPLEPNFTWELEGVTNTQHRLTIDLGESKTCDSICLIHHESVGINWELAWADDLVNWVTVTLSEHDGSAINTTSAELIKAYSFTAVTARYWRAKMKGITPINFYAPVDARISMAWLGTVHRLDRGGAFPYNDNEQYLTDDVGMSDGKVFSTGLNVNPTVQFKRTYRVNEAEYTLLREVVHRCNGSYRPFIFHEFSAANRFFCHFTDSIEAEYIESGIRVVTLSFDAMPVVQKDKVH